MEIIAVIIVLIIIGVFLLNKNPNPQQMNAEQMMRYVSSLRNWIERYNKTYAFTTPPDDLKRKYEEKNKKLDEAMRIWGQKSIEASKNNDKANIATIFKSQFEMLGLSNEDAMTNSLKMVEEALSDLPKDINPYEKNQGHEKIKDNAFMKPRLEAGLTINDIQSYWNKQPLIISCEFKMRQMQNFAFLHMAEDRGEDIKAAAAYYKKATLRYGITHKWDFSEKQNEGLSINDAEIYPEFSDRINNWINKTTKIEIDALIEEHGTLNSAARALIKEGVI